MKTSDLSKVEVIDMLEKLSVKQITDRGNEIVFACPFHNDSHPSANMNRETTLFVCHGCGEKGSAITFVAKIEGISYQTAERWLREAYGTDFREPKGGLSSEIEQVFDDMGRIEPRRTHVPPSEGWAETFMDSLRWPGGKSALDYMIGRGFPEGTLDEWQIGLDEISGRVVVPVRDLDGRLVGFKGRAIHQDVEPRYLVVGGNRYGYDRYKVSEVVFGLHRNRATRTAVLVEGELDAISLASYGFERPIALGMSSLSSRHITLIREEVDELVVFFDTDDAGLAGTIAVVEAFEPFIRVRVVQDHDGDPNSMGREAALELIESARPSIEVEVSLS